jgi:hypothetical protein
LSGRCKENIEHFWSRAEVRSLCILSPLLGIHSALEDIVVSLIVAGDLAAYLIGLVTEREFGGQVSLIVFLVLYFLFLWVAWVLAVWITKPSHAEPAST